MTKSERKLITSLALHFSDMSNHLLNFDEMMSKPNANIEQVEASVFYTLQARNKMVDVFREMRPIISKGIREEVQRVIKTKKDKKKLK